MEGLPYDVFALILDYICVEHTTYGNVVSFSGLYRTSHISRARIVRFLVPVVRSTDIIGLLLEQQGLRLGYQMKRSSFDFCYYATDEDGVAMLFMTIWWQRRCIHILQQKWSNCFLQNGRDYEGFHSTRESRTMAIRTPL